MGSEIPRPPAITGEDTSRAELTLFSGSRDLAIANIDCLLEEAHADEKTPQERIEILELHKLVVDNAPPDGEYFANEAKQRIGDAVDAFRSRHAGATDGFSFHDESIVKSYAMNERWRIAGVDPTRLSFRDRRNQESSWYWAVVGEQERVYADLHAKEAREKAESGLRSILDSQSS